MRIILLLGCLLFSQFSIAHEMAPSLLQIVEQSDQSFNVTWKTPKKVRFNKPPKPVLPGYCHPIEKPDEKVVGTAVVKTWPMTCALPLAGSTIRIEGMAGSGTATLVKVDWYNGNSVQQLLNMNKTEVSIPEQQTSMQVATEYSILGVEHIWLGIDHLLFVLALVLLVSSTKRLLWTITSFTVGHSITLSLVSLGYLDFPIPLIEFAIAGSILVLAIDLSASRNAADLSSRWIPSHSWMVAIGFGLLHGMGFAAVLSEIGLPQGDIPIALLTFNIGIEIGQVVFILACLGVMAMARRLAPAITVQGRWCTVYVIGSMSAFWCIERGLGVIGY